jgi:TetR/AcrR family tetracycline transcriptional repressor
MRHEDNTDRQLAQLEEAQRRTNERLAAQRERIDQRFDRMRERLAQRHGSPTDNQQRIIGAALELLGEDGLNNLSLRKLASRLQLQAPALYWHFKSKDVLVDYMAEAILSREFHDLAPRRPDESWPHWLRSQMVKLRRAMLAYPDGGRVVAGAHLFPAVTLGQLFECTLESLESAGIDLQTARHILMTTSTYAFGFVIEEQAAPNPEEVDMLDQEAMTARFPYAVRAMQEAHRLDRNMDHDYEVGLGYIIRGSAGDER